MCLLNPVPRKLSRFVQILCVFPFPPLHWGIKPSSIHRRIRNCAIAMWERRFGKIWIHRIFSGTPLREMLQMYQTDHETRKTPRFFSFSYFYNRIERNFTFVPQGKKEEIRALNINFPRFFSFFFLEHALWGKEGVVGVIPNSLRVISLKAQKNPPPTFSKIMYSKSGGFPSFSTQNIARSRHFFFPLCWGAIFVPSSYSLLFPFSRRCLWEIAVCSRENPEGRRRGEGALHFRRRRLEREEKDFFLFSPLLPLFTGKRNKFLFQEEKTLAGAAGGVLLPRSFPPG